MDTALILATNDDGVDAPGLRALASALRGIGRVVTVAPSREQSGASHALTLHQPLRLRRIEEDIIAVDGTPADCVLIAVRNLLERHPDVVVSGVNDGPNLGDDVNYSGTVAAALEGGLLGIPSLAVSVGRGDGRDFDFAARIAADLTRQLLAHESPFPPERDLAPEVGGRPRGRRRRDRVVLNVNIPGTAPERVREVRLTRLGRRVYQDAIIEKVDPRGARYFWIAGEPAWVPENDGVVTDIVAVEAGHVSVTPLRLDATDYDGLGLIRSWKIEEPL